ncbi:MAG TPA: ABC transporter permease [Gemmataceae bacterium]|nr:ABC transporter permease [Gemmataceae bacterium]
MTKQAPVGPAPPPVGGPPPDGRFRRFFNDLLAIRKEIGPVQSVLFGLLCVAVCFALWWYITRGEPSERIVPPTKGLPSPEETLESFESLWFDRELTRNTYASLRRVTLGFGLAALVGIPLGVLAGCFARVHAFFNPLATFGRNIPVAALIPLTFSFFGISEFQKVMFIFIASVAFVFSDTARAVQDVGTHYIDTAYTLGASRWQVIMKVLVPLAMPSVFNSLRLLFGLAFGYIMLAEVITIAGEGAGGLGHIINVSQRQGPREHIILILLIIPIVALVIDRILYWIQRELFPYRYGGAGILNQLLGVVLHGWDDLKSWFWKPSPEASLILSQARQPERA